MSNMQIRSNSNRLTSLPVSRHVKDRLDKIGRINRSYSELITQLIDYYKQGHTEGLRTPRNKNVDKKVALQHEQVGRLTHAEAAVTYSIPGVIPDTL